MNTKSNLFPWRRIKASWKLSDVNLLEPRKKLHIKNQIENVNSFYKRLVGMDKVESQRSNLINLQGKLINSKNDLKLEQYRLKLTRDQIKRNEEEIMKTDRLQHYERFAELLNKEKSLKCEEEELMEKVKLKENKRETIIDKLDTTKTTILMLEKDHTSYHTWLKYFFSAVAFVSTGLYISDNKKILDGIAEIKKMHKSRDEIPFKQIFQLLGSSVYGGCVATVNNLYWGCGKCYGGLKCCARGTWDASKWVGGKTVTCIKAGAEATKVSYSYVSWAASSGYGQVKKLIYPKKDN